MNKDNQKAFISVFQSAIKDIEALKEFYYRTRQSINVYRIEIEKQYECGKKIADLLDSIYLKDSNDEKNQRIDQINEMYILPNVLLKQICIISKFKHDTKTIQFSMASQFKDDAYSPLIAAQKFDALDKNQHILVSSILSNIVTIFESALSRFYRILIMANPLRYFENQSISLAAVFNDFGKALNDKIDQEVESKMYNSLAFINTLEELEGIQIDRYEKIKSMFTEIYYRRNSYIHTNGRANKKYLTEVDTKYTNGIKEGQRLICDDIYLENAIIILTKILFYILFELFKSHCDEVILIHNLGDYFFERLKNEEYELASCGYYALSQYKQLDFKMRTMFRINYINAQKQIGNQALVDKELKELDVSIATDEYKIAKECLLNNHKTVYDLLVLTYPNSFGAIEIKEWPIFIDFRKTEWYTKFVALHNKDFDLEQIEPENNLKDDVGSNN